MSRNRGRICRLAVGIGWWSSVHGSGSRRSGIASGRGLIVVLSYGLSATDITLKSLTSY